MPWKAKGCRKGHETLEVFTTRPDTIFGMSFCAVSPDHPLAAALAKNDKELQGFIDECHRMGTSAEEIERAEKKGYDTGLKVVHPFRKTSKVPLYVANFILMDYGTGAIFGCPAHDQRDLEFRPQIQAEGEASGRARGRGPEKLHASATRPIPDRGASPIPAFSTA